MPIYCQGMEKRSFLLFRVSKWPLSFDVSPTFQHKDSLREFPGDGSALLTPQHPATSSFIQQSWCIAHQSPPVTLATLLGDAFQIIVNAMPPAHWTYQLSPQITLQTISLWHVLIQSSAPSAKAKFPSLACKQRSSSTSPLFPNYHLLSFAGLWHICHLFANLFCHILFLPTPTPLIPSPVYQEFYLLLLPDSPKIRKQTL